MPICGSPNMICFDIVFRLPREWFSNFVSKHSYSASLLPFYWKFNESVLTNSFYCLPNSYEIIFRDEKMARENEKIQQNILSTNFLRKQKSKRGSVKKGIKTGSRETVKPRFLAHCGVWREIGMGWQNRSKNVKKTVWFGLVSSSAKLASKPKTQWVHFKSHS